MLPAIAIGDAYGACFEDVNTAITREHDDLSGTIQHKRRETKPWQDDGQICVLTFSRCIAVSCRPFSINRFR